PPRGETLEFVSHLFFAEPGEVDPHTAATFIRTEMELLPPYDTFAREILECLIAGAAAHAVDRSGWVSTGSPAIADLIGMLYKNHRAFKGVDRAESLAKHMKLIRRRRLKEAIKKL